MRKFFSLLLLALIFISCGEDAPTATPIDTTLRITSITPNPVKIGERITIEGNNFSSNRAANKIIFPGNIIAYPDSATTTKLFKVVPQGVVSGQLKLIVNEKSVTADLKIKSGLQILNFSPKADSIGKQVVITLENIPEGANNFEVYFSDVKADIVDRDGSQLKVTIPQDAETGKITIKAANDSAVTREDFVIYGALPKLLSFEPDHGPAGTELSIFGQNFPVYENTMVVLLGSDTAKILERTATSIRIEVPAGKTKERKIVIALLNRKVESNSLFRLTSKTKFSDIYLSIDNIFAKFEIRDTIIEFGPNGNIIGKTIHDTTYDENLNLILRVDNANTISNSDTTKMLVIWKHNEGTIREIDTSLASFSVAPDMESISDIQLYHSYNGGISSNHEVSLGSAISIKNISIPFNTPSELAYSDYFANNRGKIALLISNIKHWSYEKNIDSVVLSDGTHISIKSSDKRLNLFEITDKTFLKVLNIFE